jgi:magnesium-transporting ATPase (P-type)
MSSFNVPSTQSNREIFKLGIIISTMVYGGIATLVLTYISLLLKTSHAISRRLRNFLLAYVVFMVAISTVNTVTLIIAFTIGRNILPFGKPGTLAGNMIDLLTFPNGMAGALCVTFASWGADGFMVSLLIQMSGRGASFNLC